MLSLNIGHLFGDLMNVYGDDGNILTLKKRCEWRGIQSEIINISVGAKLGQMKGGKPDLYFFGGGQDQSQIEVGKDLLNKKSDILKGELERGVPLLSICGGYQLLGAYYKPHNGPKIEGLGFFPIFTQASFDRMIGNLVIESPFGKLVGFENHSGKTYLEKGALPLGNVIKGFGNNGEDEFEGCIYKNAIGCYLHGPLLPKNPHLADWLIKKALEVKYKKKIELRVLDDNLEILAHEKALSMYG